MTNNNPPQPVDMILRTLDSLRKAQDEPDFMHSITKDAHRLAKEIVESAYTHPVGSAPTPAAAPDGDGGVVVEWKSGKRVVRLVLSTGNNSRGYIYSRGEQAGLVNHEISGTALAGALCLVFPAQPDVAGVPELLPCPFCGPGQSCVDLYFDDTAYRYRVGCGRCGCSTGTSPRNSTPAPAITAWNTRATQPATAPGDADDLHLAICQAVALMNQGDLHGGHDLLRQTLVDFADKKAPLSRSEIVRQQQRSGAGEVTAVMVSSITPDVTEKARRAVDNLNRLNMLLADATDEELSEMVDIIAAEFMEGERRQ